MVHFTKDLIDQLIQSFPLIRYHIMQCVDMGDTEQLLNLLLSCEGGTV